MAKTNETKTIWVNTHGKNIAEYIMSALKIRFGNAVEVRTTTKDDPDFVPGVSVALDLLKLEALGESILASLKENEALAQKQEAEEQAKKEALLKAEQEKEERLKAVMNGEKVSSEPAPKETAAVENPTEKTETAQKEETAEEPKTLLSDRLKKQAVRFAAKVALKKQQNKFARFAAKKTAEQSKKVVESAPTEAAKKFYANSKEFIDSNDADVLSYC